MFAEMFIYSFMSKYQKISHEYASEVRKGEPSAKRGPSGTKPCSENHKWGTNFAAEGGENFEKMKVFKKKSAIYCNFKVKFGQILIDIVILD